MHLFIILLDTFDCRNACPQVGGVCGFWHFSRWVWKEPNMKTVQHLAHPMQGRFAIVGVTAMACVLPFMNSANPSSGRSSSPAWGQKVDGMVLLWSAVFWALLCCWALWLDWGWGWSSALFLRIIQALLDVGSNKNSTEVSFSKFKKISYYYYCLSLFIRKSPIGGTYTNVVIGSLCTNMASPAGRGYVGWIAMKYKQKSARILGILLFKNIKLKN